MVLAPLPTPERFPCWCRAVYSWGGESKRDLGFIEGDLIECLNAGDGSWWVGRLYRDRRSVGSFPSNFVEVLPASFRPNTRSVSPLPGSSTPSPKIGPVKSKTFRKPFEAYVKAPHYTTAKQPELFREVVKPKPTQKLEREHSGASRSDSTRDRVIERRSSPPRITSHNSRAPSPAPPFHHSRAPSPAPPFHHSRAPSPAPPRHHHSRAPSPAPSFHHQRAPSPAPSFRQPSYNVGDDISREDSPPPPPPPHRHVTRSDSDEAPKTPRHHTTRTDSDGSRRNHARDRSGDFEGTAYDLSRHPSNASFRPYNPSVMSRQDSNASYQPQPLSRHGSHLSYYEGTHDTRREGHRTPRPPSPQQPSPGGSHMTPSPLREAMDGVMQQLDQLQSFSSQDGRGSPDRPVDIWSPESFDMVSDRSRRKNERVRPLTSMGIAHSDEGYETWSGESSQNTNYRGQAREKQHDLPHLHTYVDRMEKQFKQMHRRASTPEAEQDMPPPPPPKGQPYERPKSSMGDRISKTAPECKLRARKSAYEVGQGVSRTYTTKTNITNESSSTNQTSNSSSTKSSSRTLWSGASASGFSSTSAGSLARTQQRTQSAFGSRDGEVDRPETPFTGVTYHSSHASDFDGVSRPKSQAGFQEDSSCGLGGLVQPKAAKRSIFKKIFDSAKTGVANSRGHMSAASLSSITSPKSSPFSRSLAASSTPMTSMTGLSSPYMARDTAREMGLGNSTDWVQVRRDVNRSNSLSRIEKTERKERCQMLDHPTLNPVDELYEGVEGDEGADGLPVDRPVDFQAINLSQVDKNSRFVSGLPPMITAITLATTYVCRPYRSDVQRLRAIFTWVSEKICWEEDFEGDIDTRRIIQSKRACAEEYAILVMEMCSAIGVHCEVVRGYLKVPGEVPELNMMPRPNHWWNAVVIDNEWRIMDCCLASPSHPRRSLYSGASGTTADTWWFLARPLEVCWTHVPEHHDQQHIVPPAAHEALLNLPCTCPSFFQNAVEMVDYNTCLTRIEDLEMVHIKFDVPADIEVAAEVEARAYSQDADGDFFESGDVVKKRALAQAEWFNGIKRYTVKALLPADEGQGILKIYAGRRGLMHSIKDIPHPLAFSLPIIHTGENPAYDFVTRHPTPHAQRHDIYVVQPQCQRLALNNTFVFAIRQHPSSLSNGPQSILTPSSNPGGTSPIPFLRPSSAMSMNASTSGTGSNPSSASGTVAGQKPAKLAIQTPGGKILRLMRKEDRKGLSVGSRGLTGDDDMSDGGTWETIIKCSEKGTWRGLVLADRTARWCVFAEWVCMG